MENNTIIGIITEISEVNTYGKLELRTVVVEHNDKYPNEVELQFSNKLKDLPNMYKIGDKVMIEYSLFGAKYNGKRYLKANAFSIAKIQ